MCNLLFDNFLNVFFKIPNAFFTTFLSLNICQLKYISKIMCFTFVCILLVKNHEPRQKWATFISQDVGPNTILCSMFKIEQIMRLSNKGFKKKISWIIRRTWHVNKHISKLPLMVNH